MQTASIREIRQNFPRIMAWISDGEQVQITMRRKVIARLIPETSSPRSKAKIPDFGAIRKEVFGNKTFSGSLVEQERESSKW